MAKKKTILLFTLFSVIFFIIGVVSAQAANLELSVGWNLVSFRIQITAGETFSDDAEFASIWKWQDSNWAVYLPGETTAGEYAAVKGFYSLTTISPGEGFWVNSTGIQSVSVTGTEVTSADITLDFGWNLKGLKTDSSINVGSIFSDSTKFASVWKWADSKWAVHLPGETTPGTYASSKGFEVLSTIAPGQGFWVNAGQSSDIDVETPPVPGLTVYEIRGENQLIPFKDYSAVWQGTDLVVQADGFTNQTFSEGSIPEIIMMQPVDPLIQRVELQEEILTKLSINDFLLKPVPKTLKSSDNMVTAVISSLTGLDIDITVAISPLIMPSELPSVDQLLTAGRTIVSGALFILYDSSGNKIGYDDLPGFSTGIALRNLNILGNNDFVKVSESISNDGILLKLFAYTVSGWVEQGVGIVQAAESPYYFRNQTSLDKLYPAYAFVLENIPSANTKPVQFKLSHQNNPLEKVKLIINGQYELTTDSQGQTGSIQLPLINGQSPIPIVSLKQGYKTRVLNVDTAEMESYYELIMDPEEGNLNITGLVTDGKTGEAIKGARVLVQIPVLLDRIEKKKLIDGEPAVLVGLSDTATYRWEYSSYGQDNYIEIKEATGTNDGNVLKYSEIESVVSAEGFYNLMLTVTHGSGENSYQETNDTGTIKIEDEGGTKKVIVDIYPVSSQSNIMEILTTDTIVDSLGTYNYKIDNIDPSQLGLLKLKAQKYPDYIESNWVKDIAGPAGSQNEILINFTLDSAPHGSIKGMVKTQSNEDPVSGAQILIKGMGTESSAQTDSAGLFSFSTMYAGAYSLFITPKTGDNLQSHLGSVVVAGGKESSVDVKLAASAGSAAEPPKIDITDIYADTHGKGYVSGLITENTVEGLKYFAGEATLAVNDKIIKKIISQDDNGVFNWQFNLLARTNNLTITALNDKGPGFSPILILKGYPSFTDITPPELLTFSMDPAEVDVTGSAQDITFQFEAGDDMSGINPSGISVMFIGPIASEIYQELPGNGTLKSIDLISGDAYRGVYQGMITMDPEVKPGKYGIIISLADETGNNISFDYDNPEPDRDLEERGFQPYIEVINSNTFDSNAPVLTDLSIDIKSFDVTSESKTITITFSATDDISGINLSGISASFTGPIDSESFTAMPGNGTQTGVELKTGTGMDGTYSVTISFDNSVKPGNYGLILSLSDVDGNSISYDYDNSDPARNLVQLGFDSIIQIANETEFDVMPPEIVSFSMTQSLIDVTSGSQSVSVTVEAKDPGSGLNSTGVFAGFTGPIASETYTEMPGNGSMETVTMISGDKQQGKFQFDISFDITTKPGQYGIVISLEDIEGNNTSYDYDNPDPARDLEQLGFAPYLTIANDNF